MKVAQHSWSPSSGWSGDAQLGSADLVLAFGACEALEAPGVLDELSRRTGRGPMLTCSTAGEIAGVRVFDGGISAASITFADTRVRGVEVPITEATSRAAGEAVVDALLGPDLVHVLCFSDGVRVNGSELVRGLTAALPQGVRVTGGLAGDGARFERTLVGWASSPREGRVAAVGFYGSRLEVGCGSLGGWDPFGPDRLVTRSRANVLYELDGEPALDLYKKYLGTHAAGLPSSALLFPLSIRGEAGRGVVRTILSVREEDSAMIFAGDVPEGSYARLMKANFDRLIDGAVGAADASARGRSTPATLAVLVSCVGRKLVLKQRVEEEVEGVRQVLGTRAALVGFYSYGEISPFTPDARCELHNQTMTVTTFSERGLNQ